MMMQQIQDGGRRHIGFRFRAIILASINIFAPNLVPRWKSAAQGDPVLRYQIFRKSKMADGIAKVLLNTKPYVVWESFGDVGFPTSEKVWREKKIKKELSVKYNGSLALAMLEQLGDQNDVITCRSIIPYIHIGFCTSYISCPCRGRRLS